MRTGFVPEVEMPHFKAMCLRLVSLRVEGIVSAMHVEH